MKIKMALQPHYLILEQIIKFFFALLVCFFMISSSWAGEVINKNEIIGHWRCLGKGGVIDEYFNADGTSNGTFTVNNEILWRFSTNWSLDKNILSYQFTYSSRDWASAGTKDEDEIFEISEDHYTIKAKDGSVRRYTKVGDKSDYTPFTR